MNDLLLELRLFFIFGCEVAFKVFVVVEVQVHVLDVGHEAGLVAFGFGGDFGFVVGY